MSRLLCKSRRASPTFNSNTCGRANLRQRTSAFNDVAGLSADLFATNTRSPNFLTLAATFGTLRSTSSALADPCTEKTRKSINTQKTMGRKIWQIKIFRSTTKRATIPRSSSARMKNVLRKLHRQNYVRSMYFYQRNAEKHDMKTTKVVAATL